MPNSWEWLFTICAADGQENCIEPVQLAYLGALVVGALILFVATRRTRDMSTAVLALMPVAIAINIAVGATVAALKLPLYLDSIGTVLVGVLAGPWAGALTGLLSNLIWALLPIPGGGGPIIAFFAPVAGVIGLMAGFWGARGVFQLRADDARVGSFLSLALGIAAAGLAFLALQLLVGLPDLSLPEADAQLQANQLLFVTEGLAIIGLGAVVAWVARRTIFAFRGTETRIRPYLAAASGIASAVLLFVVLRLLFSEAGWFATLDGSAESGLPALDLSGLVVADPLGFFIDLAVSVIAGIGVWYWAGRGNNARFFPVWIGGLTTGLVAAAMSAPISAGVFGGVTGSGQDLLVTLYRTLGLNVLQAAFAQGLTSDPLDKTISYTVVFLILTALPLTVRTMFSRGETTVTEEEAPAQAAAPIGG